MNEAEYLAGVHVTRLQAAARMAGLRWKNGDPGTDKAGIINRLLQHPSILRATVATLQRMEKGEPAPTRKPVIFEEDDFTDDDAPVTPNPAPTLQQPIGNIDAAILRDYVKRDVWESANHQIGAVINAKAVETGKALQAIREDIDSLKQRAPIQFVFPAGQTVIVDPTDHHESFPTLIQYLQTNRRCILTGSAGTGKSMAAKNAAAVLPNSQGGTGLPFYLMTPVTASHELIGHRDAHGVFHETPLFAAYTRGGLVLLDEMDASLADAMLCANPILDGNGFAMFGDGIMHEQHPDFVVIANMNTDGNGATMEYPGRTRLDGATLARFGVRIHWNIDARIERQMAEGQVAWHQAVVAVRDFMTQREIVDVNATPRHVKTGAKILNAGGTRERVLIDVLKSGALAQAWAEVLRLPAVQSFLRGQ